MTRTSTQIRDNYSSRTQVAPSAAKTSTSQTASAKSAAPKAGAAAKRSDQEAYTELINKDFQIAFHRKPSDTEYKYWMEKLQGPNDSGLVTSGQMTATEYWHRRMLGWQGGGADIVPYGPYAGSSEAHGEVPKATDLVPDVPSGIVAASSPTDGFSPSQEWSPAPAAQASKWNGNATGPQNQNLADIISGLEQALRQMQATQGNSDEQGTPDEQLTRLANKVMAGDAQSGQAFSKLLLKMEQFQSQGVELKDETKSLVQQAILVGMLSGKVAPSPQQQQQPQAGFGLPQPAQA